MILRNLKEAKRRTNAETMHERNETPARPVLHCTHFPFFAPTKKDVLYSLPENGLVFYAWASGILALRINLNGTLSIRGASAPLAAGSLTSTLTKDEAAAWPVALTSIQLCRFRVLGQLIDLSCDCHSATLHCTWKPATNAGRCAL